VRLSADRPLGLAPATVLDYRELARRRLPRQLFDYIDGGAYEEATLRANVADLERVLLRQVVMRDVSVRDPAVEVLGQRLALPVILGPVGLAGMFALRAEVQAARAAERAGVPFVESTVSICGIEEVARATSTPPWFQLYVMRDRGYAEELMARAQAVGSPVLVLTIDLAVVGARHRDTRNAIVGNPSALAKALRALDLVSHPRWVRDVALSGKPLTFEFGALRVRQTTEFHDLHATMQPEAPAADRGQASRRSFFGGGATRRALNTWPGLVHYGSLRRT
jgi:L-lactate dehydrogenase (cytochrome)